MPITNGSSKKSQNTAKRTVQTSSQALLVGDSAEKENVPPHHSAPQQALKQAANVSVVALQDTVIADQLDTELLALFERLNTKTIQQNLNNQVDKKRQASMSRSPKSALLELKKALSQVSQAVGFPEPLISPQLPLLPLGFTRPPPLPKPTVEHKPVESTKPKELTHFLPSQSWL